MPIREQEPLAGIIRMRVVNPRAPRYGETGWIVDVLQERDDQQEMVVLQLRFEADGQPVAYAALELEVVMP